MSYPSPMDIAEAEDREADMSDRVRKVWADFGPEYNPRYPANPNENCFTLAVDADDYDALADENAALIGANLAYQERLAEIIGYCAQEGNDREPYDTINAIATGEYSTKGGGR